MVYRLTHTPKSVTVLALFTQAERGIPWRDRTIYHVSPSGDQWKVQREGAARAARTFSTKQPAVSYARKTAKNNKPSQVKVHRQDGTIETEWTHGDDPYPPSG